MRHRLISRARFVPFSSIVPIELGFDYSPYAQGLATLAQAQAWYAAGLRRCALALDTAQVTFDSAVNLNAAGINLDAYRELENPTNYVAQTQNAIAAFGPLAARQVYFRRLWLTAEDVSIGKQPGILVPALQAAVNACAGFDTGIYTGGWYWPDYMGDTTAFAHLPLWTALYDHDPVIENVGFGGWIQPDAHQYDSPVVIAGVALDVDVWMLDSVPNPPTPTPPTPGDPVPSSVLNAIDVLTTWKATQVAA